MIFNKIIRILIYIGIILMPITTLKIPIIQAVFRGLADYACFYPFLVALLLWGLLIIGTNRQVVWPKNKLFVLLLCFIAWVIISGAFNIDSIIDNQILGLSGINRFFSLFIGLCFYVFVVLLIYNFLSNSKALLNDVQKICIVMMAIAGMYSVFEIGSYFQLANFYELKMGMDVLVHGDASFDPRLRSICQEPSFFAMLVSFAFPWIVSAVFDYKKYQLLLIVFNLYVMLMAFLTTSRSLYVICIIELIIWLVLSRDRWMIRRSLYLLPIILLVVIVGGYYVESYMWMDFNVVDVFLSFNKMDSVSNITRYSAQLAAFDMFVDNPIMGVGLGQYCFYYLQYLPDFGFSSPEVVLNVNEDNIPITHGLYARILAETGFVGFVLWMGMIVISLFDLFKKRKEANEKYRYNNMIVSLVGISMVGFMHDSFSLFYFWVLLSICLIVTTKDCELEDDE